MPNLTRPSLAGRPTIIWGYSVICRHGLVISQTFHQQTPSLTCISHCKHAAITVCLLLFFLFKYRPRLERFNRLLPWNIIQTNIHFLKRWSLICNTASQYFYACFNLATTVSLYCENNATSASKFTILLSAVFLAFLEHLRWKVLQTKKQ